LGGDLVATTAGREQLDDLVIGQGDDEYGQEGSSGEIETEMGILAQGEERFLRTVARGRQSVSAQPDPGKKRNQCKVVPGFRIERVVRLTDHRFLEFIEERHVKLPSHFSYARLNIPHNPPLVRRRKSLIRSICLGSRKSRLPGAMKSLLLPE